MLLSCKGIHKFYLESHVLNSIALTVEDHDRIGLVGDNGCGKSTLLRIIVGEELPDSFEAEQPVLTQAPGLRIGYLAQNAGLDSSKTVSEEMNDAFAPLHAALERMRELEARMQHSLSEAEAEEYARLSAYVEVNDGYHTDVQIRTVLNGMGFDAQTLPRKISGFSGGEKTRLALCRLLLEAPDLLILDEPTNHLDFSTVSWLEEYLKSWRGALLIVSHDRLFLDRLCTSVCELDHGILTRYKGNYTAFTRLREEARERRQREYVAQQREIGKLEDYIAKNKVRASTAKSAKSREKQLEKIERIEKPFSPNKSARLRFTYSIVPPIDVLEVQNIDLTVGAGSQSRTLIDSLSFSVRRGEKLAIIGENGTGKTTLLKVLRNLLPHKGRVTWAAGVRLSCFEQESESLNPFATVLDEMHDRFPLLSNLEIRSLLGQVRLTGENVLKETGVISGGERAKLCFAILMLEHGNVLLLDEPTNHLDLTTKEILEQALAEFDGTILFVSHDRYLLERLADRLLILKQGQAELFSGKFSAYQQELRRRAESGQAETAAEKETQRKKQSPDNEQNAYHSKEQRVQAAKRRQEQRELEKQIDTLQEEENTLKNRLQEEEILRDYETMQKICTRLEEIHAEQESLFERLVELEE